MALGIKKGFRVSNFSSVKYDIPGPNAPIFIFCQLLNILFSFQVETGKKSFEKFQKFVKIRHFDELTDFPYFFVENNDFFTLLWKFFHS